MATTKPKISERGKRGLDEFRLSADTYKNQRDREIAYLKFQVPEFQWDPEIRDYRTSQFSNQGVPTPPDPTLSISMIDEPLSLVANQERAAHLGVQIHPLSENASKATAQVLQELYRHIEIDPDSKASNVRTWGFDRAHKAGLGWYYITKVHDPEGGHPFDQKIIVMRLLYQDCIFPDPTAQQPDWSDGEFLHDLVDLPWKKYKRKYPHSRLSKYTEKDFVTLGNEQPGWVSFAKSSDGTSEDRANKDGWGVRISNYWSVDIVTRRYVLLDDGSVTFDDEIPDGRREADDDDASRLGHAGARSMEIEERHVYKIVMNGLGEELAEESEWDGQYIPYVPMVGVELQPFDGERRWVGMIANAMDAQKLVNYSASQAVKLAALEPQAPWQGEEGVFEGHEQEYAQSNTRKFPFLQYKPTNTAGIRSTPPARVQVDTTRLGPSMELLGMGKDFVQRAMFTFGPGLGEQTPAHRSGTAINLLQGQTEIGTSHYLDNEATISIPLEAKIILDLIPHVYDRPGRILHVLGLDNQPKQVMVNHPYAPDASGKPQKLPYGTPAEKAATDARVADPNDPAAFIDLNQGRYGVTVTISKQSDARLQEGSDAVGRLMESEPALLPVLGPEWAKWQDFPGAPAIAEALKKWQQHAAPWMNPPGQTDAIAQIGQMQQQLQTLSAAAQQMKQIIDTKQVEQQAKIEVEKISQQTSIEIQRMKDATQIEVARITAAKEGIIAAREAQEERLATGLKIAADAASQQREHAHEATQAGLDRTHEIGQAAREHAAGVAQAGMSHAQDLESAEQDNAHALMQADAQRQAAEAAPSGSDTQGA